MKKIIVFQGDSITDTGRNREDANDAGAGYPLLVKAELGFDYPERYGFFNRGISGNRVVDLYARIKKDIINLKPDYLSILIGVNDVWHEIGSQNGVEAPKYEKIFNMLIEEIKEALPEIKIMILEPFVLEASATENNKENPERWPIFRKEVALRAAAAKRVAARHGLPFIELQSKLNEVSAHTENAYWLSDGVHPTAMGHELIAKEWLKAFRELTNNEQ